MTDCAGNTVTREMSPYSPLWRDCSACAADAGEDCSERGESLPQGIFHGARIRLAVRINGVIQARAEEARGAY